MQKSLKTISKVLLSSYLLYLAPQVQAFGSDDITVPTVIPGDLIRSSNWNEIRATFLKVAESSWKNTGTNLHHVGGNVGIGTTTPSEKLEISGGRILVTGSGYVSNPGGPVFGQYSNTVGYAQAPSGGNFQIWKDDTTAIATFSDSGNVGIGTTSPNKKLDVNGWIQATGIIQSITDATHGIQLWPVNDSLVRVNAYTGQDLGLASGGVDRIYIKNTGNVGIGTTSPSSKLHIKGDGLALNIQSTAANQGSDLTWKDENGSSMWAFSQRATSRDLHLFRNGGGTPVMVFNRGTGNVGIGTTTTSGDLKLDVEGKVGATQYCDENGDNCKTVVELAAGGSGSGGSTSTGVIPSFSVHRNNIAQSVPNLTWTGIDWTTEKFDTNNDFDTTTDRFTVTVAGKYLFTARTRFEALNDNSTSYMVIEKNGSNIIADYKYATGTYRTTQVTVIDDAQVGDYFKVKVYHNYSGSRNILGSTTYTQFTGSLLGGGAGESSLWTANGSDISRGTGNVGIGTTSPGKNLDVVGEIRVQNPNYPKYHLNATSNGVDLKKWQMYVRPTTGNFRLAALNDAETAEVGGLNIARNGNVGIGTTSPAAKLQVNGNIKVGREGIGGTYNSTQVQGIWSIQQNYKIDTANNNFGNQYGMVYSHTNAGTTGTNKPIAGWGHQIGFTNNGVRNATISLSTGKIAAKGYCDENGGNCKTAAQLGGSCSFQTTYVGYASACPSGYSFTGSCHYSTQPCVFPNMTVCSKITCS